MKTTQKRTDEWLWLGDSCDLTSMNQIPRILLENFSMIFRGDTKIRQLIEKTWRQHQPKNSLDLTQPFQTMK